MSKLFIFEGPDGAGKTELCKTIVEQLELRGLEVLHYRQPGGTALGEELRKLLLNKELSADAMSQVYMFYASRRQALSEVSDLPPNNNRYVLTDRFELSSLSYQSALYKQDMIDKYGEEKGMSLYEEFIVKVDKINSIEMEEVDCKYIILDAPDEILNSRRENGDDRFEARDNAFKSDIRRFYRDWTTTLKDDPTVMELDSSKPFTDEEIQSIVNFIIE